MIAGFVLAAAAIIASIGDRPFVRFAKRSGVYSRLVSRLFSLMRWCFASAVLFITAIAFKPEWRLEWYPYAIWIWGFTAFTALLSAVRVAKTFALFMKLIGDE